MGPKEIGKRIGNIALRLATVGCGCSGECWGCASCGNLPPPAPEEGKGNPNSLTDKGIKSTRKFRRIRNKPPTAGG